MPKINILDDFTVNQIAAGEVIERPSSIVKELVENSIDAGSSAITIEIQDGGVSLIRVTDNGEGMDKTDARLCFQRHATSKIKSNTDLYSINSLGFRGEALASIAAVSRVELFTSPRNAAAGIHIVNHGGKVVSEKEIGCPEGTTIVVRNLFYNAPARLKFLKSARVETANISELVGRLILAHPEISFRYINQGKTVYHSPGNGSLFSAVISVFGKDIRNQVIEINRKRQEGDISLYGYIGRASLSRINRSSESFIVNGRYVKSPLMSKAVEDAYRSYVMVNRFPWVVLHLDLPADQIDVNVHPAKTEIRFKTEQEIYKLIFDWVKECLEKHPHIPVISRESFERSDYNGSQTDDRSGLPDTALDTQRQENRERIDKTVAESQQIDFDQHSREPRHVYIAKKDSPGDSKLIKNGNNGMEYEVHEHNIDRFRTGTLKVIGRAFSTYIIVEEQDRVFFVDQHAAHERLIYQELNESLNKRTAASQQLLPPVILELTHDESLIVEAAQDILASLGFDIEHFGGNTWTVRGVPYVLKGTNVRELFHYVLDQWGIDSRTPEPSMLIKPEDIMRAACRQAVKARDPLSDREIVYLLERFRNDEIPLTCPHGRPIIVTITKYELEKKFKRIQ